MFQIEHHYYIMTYAQLNEDEMVDHSPKVAVLNENNEIIEMIFQTFLISKSIMTLSLENEFHLISYTK
jgi:aspartate 1-decarboxylase